MIKSLTLFTLYSFVIDEKCVHHTIFYDRKKKCCFREKMRNHNKSLGGIEGNGNTGGSKWQFPVKVMQFAHRQKWDCHQSPAVFSIYDTEFEN